MELFRVFTGAPVEKINHDFLDDVWDKISNAYYEGSIICALADSEDDYKYSPEDDLSSSYAYYVSGIHEITSGGCKIRLLEVTKPDKIKWLNLFGDTTEKWKHRIRSRVGDNSVLVTLRDYVCYFNHTLVCSANSRFASSSMRCRQYNDPTLLKVSLFTSEKVSFTIHQIMKKYLGRSSLQKSDYMRIIIARVEESGELTYTESRFSDEE